MVIVGICLTTARKGLNLLEFDAYPLGFGACRTHADLNSLPCMVEQEFGESDHCPSWGLEELKFGGKMTMGREIEIGMGQRRKRGGVRSKWGELLKKNYIPL